MIPVMVAQNRMVLYEDVVVAEPNQVTYWTATRRNTTSI